MSKAHCKAKRSDGQTCQMAAGKSGYCFNHDPGKGRQRAEARKRGGELRHTPHFGDSDNLPREVRTLQDASTVLTYTLAEVIGMDNSIARARVLLALFDSFVKALQVGELEQRLEAIENSLKARS